MKKLSTLLALAAGLLIGVSIGYSPGADATTTVPSHLNRKFEGGYQFKNDVAVNGDLTVDGTLTSSVGSFVTAGSTLTAHKPIVGSGTSALAVISSAGTSGQPLISGGSSADPAYGTLGVAGGGTGDATLTSHGVLVGAGTSAVAATSAGTSGQVLISGGASADPSYGLLTSSNAATVSANNVVAGLVTVYVITVPGGATGNTDVVITNKSHILIVTGSKITADGKTGDTIQVDNGTGGNHITNAVDLNGPVNSGIGISTYDPAYTTVAAGGTIRVVHTNGGDGASSTACTLYLLAYNVP